MPDVVLEAEHQGQDSMPVAQEQLLELLLPTRRGGPGGELPETDQLGGFMHIAGGCGRALTVAMLPVALSQISGVAG